MSKLLKEPLLYFLALGGALFLLFQQVSDEMISGAQQLEEIVVTATKTDTPILELTGNTTRSVEGANHSQRMSSM